jgi:hypothetical protein
MTTVKLEFEREIKRVYRDGCRYNERLNTETGGSKTPHVHWVEGKHTVRLVLVVTHQKTVDLVRRSRIRQETKVPKCM